MSNFQKYSQYYDLLYEDKNYKEESKYVIDIIEKLNSKAKSILELGSGSGSHAFFLAENGFEITGIEQSQEMINQSLQKNIINFKSILGDISKTKISQKFDVVVSIFHVISYLNDNNSLINCFQNTYNHLNDEGIFIFDVWYSPAVFHQKPETRIKRLENQEIEILRIAESKIISEKNVVEVNFDVSIKDKKTNISENLKEKHSMRHFSIPEIELLAKFTGFEIVLVEEFLTKKLPSIETWGVCFILKKVNQTKSQPQT